MKGRVCESIRKNGANCDECKNHTLEQENQNFQVFIASFLDVYLCKLKNSKWWYSQVQRVSESLVDHIEACSHFRTPRINPTRQPVDA